MAIDLHQAEENVETIAAGDRSLKVDIHIHPEYLQSLLAGDRSPFPPKLQQLTDGTRQEFFW